MLILNLKQIMLMINYYTSFVINHIFYFFLKLIFIHQINFQTYFILQINFLFILHYILCDKDYVHELTYYYHYNILS